MPRLLIYEECLAAGTTGPLGSELTAELLVEGQAMAFALAEDCAKVSGWHVSVARSSEYRERWPQPEPWRWLDYTPTTEESLDDWLSKQSARVDATLVIAPECQGILEQRARAVIASGGRLLGPDSDWIALTSDKTATLQRLESKLVPVPRGIQGTLQELSVWTGSFPAIIKPNDGVGGTGIRKVLDHNSLLSTLNELAIVQAGTKLWRCEEFVEGQAASVTILGGSKFEDVLLPGAQKLEFDAQGLAHYAGGSFTLTENQIQRAQDWGFAVCRALPPTKGYFGIDMVLGSCERGTRDVVIEVNPRLTSSYLGLRVSNYPLARSILKYESIRYGHICWSLDQLEFTKQGQVFIRERS